MIEAEIHVNNTDAQHMVQFEEAQDLSDAGSLITQAPQSQAIHATINTLSTWAAAIQPRESWYLARWIGDSPIDFLVDPGAVVSAISLQSYEKLMESNAKLTPMRAIHMELEAANKSVVVVVCWSLTSLCRSNGHIETMPAREINPFTAQTRIRSQFLRTQ